MSKTVSFLKEMLTTLFSAVLIYLLVSIFLKVGVIDGSSMEPTYHNGNRVIIARRASDFSRGSIVAFKYSKVEDDYYQETYNTTSDYPMDLHIKRILGVPGDEVEIKDNTLYINGDKISNSELTLKDQKYTLLEDEYFVQGDNINDSYDSRMHGPISSSDIYGKIMTKK